MNARSVLNSCKTVAVTIYITCKKYAGKVLFLPVAIGKILNSAASTNYSALHSLNYIEKTQETDSLFKDASTYNLYLSFCFVMANIWVTTFTRGPTIKKKLWDEDIHGLQDKGFPYSRSDFTSPYKIIYLRTCIISCISGISSMSFSMINSWNFAGSFVEWLFFMFGGIHADDKEWEETISNYRFWISLYLAACAGYSYYSYNLFKIINNAKQLADNYIEQDTSELDEGTKTLLLHTGIFTAANIITTGSFSIFSSKKSVVRLVKDLFHTELTHGTVMSIATFSTVTAMSTSFFAVTPAVYNYLKPKDIINHPHYHPAVQSHYDRTVRFTTLYVAGPIDTIATFFGNFRGGAELAHDVLNQNYHTFFSTVISMATGATGGIANYAFNIDASTIDVAKDKIKRSASMHQLALSQQLLAEKDDSDSDDDYDRMRSTYNPPDHPDIESHSNQITQRNFGKDDKTTLFAIQVSNEYGDNRPFPTRRSMCTIL